MRRTIRLLKDAHPINSIMENAKKLELLQHRTLGKRHTLLHMTMKESLDTRPQIKTPRSVKEFENLVKNIPAVENTIEKELLEAMKSHLTPLEKEELDHSYRLRQAYTETKIYEPQPIPPTPEGDPELLKIDTDLYISDVPNVKAEEIGRFFEISKEKASKLFSSGYFGDYFKDTFARNCNLDIMMREETFNLINILRASQNIESKKMFPELQNYHHMNGLNHCEQYKWLLLNCLDSYLKVLRKSAYYLNETINEREDLKVRLLMKNSPEFFYQLCFIVMTELKDQNLHDLVFRQDSLEPDPYDSLDRSFAESSIKELFNEILTVVSSKLKDDDSLNQFRLRDYVKHIAPKFTFSFKGTEFTFNFEHYSIDSFKPKHPKEIQEIINNPQTVNVGSLLTGIKGNGKSQVLAGLSYWAATEGNWFVVKVPNGSDFTRNRTEIIWDKSGMYLQPEVAYDYLLDIYNTNKEKLEHIKIKKSVYGKYNLTGLHDEYDEAYKPITPHHTWIRDLRCYGDD